MTYFNKHNQEASERLKKHIQALKIEHAKRVSEDVEVNKIINNRKKNREEYLKQRFSGRKEDLIFSIQLNKRISYKEFLEKGTKFIEKEEMMGIERAEQMMNK